MGLIKDKGRVVEYLDKSVEFRRGGRSQLGVTNEVFEHFNKLVTIPAGFTLTSEGTTTAAATYGIGLGGEATITSDDVAAKSESLNGSGLLWQADRQPKDQPLVWEAKVKAATLAANEYWFGISDALADTDPIALSLTSTFTTSVPTDALVLGYSDTPTSGAAFLTGGNSHTAISINNNTNAVVGTGTSAFVTATYYTYRIEVDKDGNAAYFIDGAFFKSKADAIRETVPLTHIAYAIPRTTASAAITLDYVYMGGV